MNEYYIDSKVTTWVRERFEAESDEQAIELAQNGEYESLDIEYLGDYTDYKTDENDDWICEVFDEHDNKIYSNYE